MLITAGWGGAKYAPYKTKSNQIKKKKEGKRELSELHEASPLEAMEAHTPFETIYLPSWFRPSEVNCSYVKGSRVRKSKLPMVP